MKGGVTYKDMEQRKQKAANCDAALAYLHGRIDSEKLLTVERILSVGLELPPSSTVASQGKPVSCDDAQTGGKR